MTSRGGAEVAALRTPVRLRVVFKYLGQLWLVQAGLIAVQFAVALRFGARELALRFGLVLVALLLVGGVLARMRASPRVRSNEAMVIAALTFVCAPFATAYPFMAAGLGFVDALFEAVSGVTTTGLSTIATLEGMPEPFLFARAFSQWYGGLGFVALILALAAQPSLLARRLAMAQGAAEDLVGGTRAHARSMLLTYGGLTVVGVAVLWLTGVDAFGSLTYALSALSTGGFSPRDGSLAALPSDAARVSLTLLSVVGAVSLVTHRKAFTRGPSQFASDRQLVVLLSLGALLTLAVTATLAWVDGLGLPAAAAHGAMMALSAQSTTGFASIELADKSAVTKVLLMMGMWVGGCAGSTAGGIKLLRMMILVRVVRAAIVRSGLPRHAVYDPRLGKRRIGEEETQDAVRVLFLFVLVIGASWVAFLAQGAPALDALFEVVSATGTVGLSTGLVGPELPNALKLVLCADMLLGRLEIVPLVVLAYPGTWSARRSRADANRVRRSQ